MKRFSKLSILSLLLAFTFMITGCSNENTDDAKENSSETQTSEVSEDGKYVGIVMPTQSLQRWNQDGNNLKNLLEEKGYKVDLQFAQNQPDTQVSMIENMIAKKVNYLVVGPIDGNTLSGVMDQAHENNIKTIAYDRLIMNTEALDYYATFDLTTVGEIQGQYIVDTLDLENEEGPFNLELVTGPMDDNNTKYFFEGAMSKLQPYIDKGTLVIKSNQTEMSQVSTPNWDEAEAQSRMENIITTFYQDEKIDAVLCSNDSVSLGSQSALSAAGYGTDEKPMPVLTGQDANIPNVQAILDGKQTMTVFKDTRTLAKEVVNMIESMNKGEEVNTNDNETYDNGSKVVPTFLIDPVAVDKDNIEEALFDSGYYNKDEFNK